MRLRHALNRTTLSPSCHRQGGILSVNLGRFWQSDAFGNLIYFLANLLCPLALPPPSQGLKDLAQIIPGDDLSQPLIRIFQIDYYFTNSMWSHTCCRLLHLFFQRTCQHVEAASLCLRRSDKARNLKFIPAVGGLCHLHEKGKCIDRSAARR